MKKTTRIKITIGLGGWVVLLMIFVIIILACTGCTALQHYNGQVMSRSNPYYNVTNRNHNHYNRGGNTYRKYK